MGGQRHAPAALLPGKRPDTHCKRWAPGPVWMGAENLAPTGIRSPDRPPRSQSLYRLSYPAQQPGAVTMFYLNEIGRNFRRFNHVAVHPGGIEIRQPEREADDSFISISLWFQQMYCILGRKSELLIGNKLLTYNTTLQPICTYGIPLCGTASNSNIEILHRYQNKVQPVTQTLNITQISK
jgi:hypothetical protein